MSAPSAGELYTQCMEAAGDLLLTIRNSSGKDLEIESKAAAARMNAQAVLALVQSAVTIHAASKTAKTGTNRRV